MIATANTGTVVAGSAELAARERGHSGRTISYGPKPAAILAGTGLQQGFAHSTSTQIFGE
jgi:hypothetical protein